MPESNTDLTSLLANYQPSAASKQIVSQTPLLLLVGISGAGKDSIKHHLLQTNKYYHVVSHTTRQPRANAGVMEVDGQDYHFISPAEAQSLLENGAFVEAKQYSGNLYGTSVAEIAEAQRRGKIAVTDLEVQGVSEYKAISDTVIAVFILPPDFQEWQRRLRTRYGQAGADPADMSKRMHTAIAELEDALAKPYFHFVINNQLDQAVAIIDDIAHNHDRFNKIDDAVHQQATRLLADLRQHTSTLDA